MTALKLMAALLWIAFAAYVCVRVWRDDPYL